MSFEHGIRRGSVWSDVLALDAIIKKTNFNLTTKSEREFEIAFANTLTAQSDKINGKIISQIDQEVSVKSVYCFGKKHRPDLTINDDGIAIEIKYLNDSVDGIKYALGQGLLYRLRYKFVFNIFVLSGQHKDVYTKACNKEEQDLEDIFKYMAEDINIFSYIVPAFSTIPNLKRIIENNNIIEQ